jgi:DNA polymerase-3 subunit delta
MESLTFLDRSAKTRLLPFYVVHGEEPFLRRQVLRAIRARVLGADAEGTGSVYEGDKATFAAVCDELETVPFFSERRLVIVESADPFVTRFRGNLEKKVGHWPATATLILEVKSWPANTRLYKMVGDEAAISCNAPAAYRLPAWCVQWCRSHYTKELTGPAASLLVDLAGADMGLLDRELEKLAIYVGNRPRIDADDVDKLVGQSRAENTWKIFDAIGAGQTRVALGMLDRLLDQGEEPLRLLGAFNMQLRRLAQAARLGQRGRPLASALEQAGVPPFAIRNAEQQLRHLGPRRAGQLYDWLVEMDLGLKGGSPLPPRILLETFVIKLAR